MEADKFGMIDLSTPLAGMQKAEASLNRTAARLATAADPQSDALDLSQEAVAMLSARTAFQANAEVACTEMELSRNLVDLLG